MIERGKRTDPSLWLDRLAVIIRHLEVPLGNGEIHPFVAVFTDMWPMLSAVCDRYKTESRVIERWCRCVRFAVRCLGSQSALFLHPIVKQVKMQFIFVPEVTYSESPIG